MAPSSSGTVPARLDSAPTWLLGRASARAHRLLVAELAAVGARGHHYRLLATLDELGPASQADLGRAAGIDRSDVAAAMLELEAGGHIHREPGHGRRIVVSLTADGIRRLTELGAVIEHVQSAVLAPLAPHEQQMLVELLVKIQPREPDPATSDQP